MACVTGTLDSAQEDRKGEEEKRTMDCEDVEEGGQLTDDEEVEGLGVEDGGRREGLGVHLLLLLALLGCAALTATGFLIGQVTLASGCLAWFNKLT